MPRLETICHLRLGVRFYEAFRESSNATKWDGMEDLPVFADLAHEEEVAWYAVARKAIEINNEQ